MSDDELTPELVTLLDVWRQRLPIGTTLEATVNSDPNSLTIYAIQHTIQAGRKTSASVWIADTAITDFGQMGAIEPALKILTDLAMYRALPLGDRNEPARMVALMTSKGLETFDPPVKAPNH